MRVVRAALLSPEGANLRRGLSLLPQGVPRPNAGSRELIQWVLIALRPGESPVVCGPVHRSKGHPPHSKIKKKKTEDFIIDFGPALSF